MVDHEAASPTCTYGVLHELEGNYRNRTWRLSDMEAPQGVRKAGAPLAPARSVPCVSRPPPGSRLSAPGGQGAGSRYTRRSGGDPPVSQPFSFSLAGQCGADHLGGVRPAGCNAAGSRTWLADRPRNCSAPDSSSEGRARVGPSTVCQARVFGVETNPSPTTPERSGAATTLEPGRLELAPPASRGVRSAERTDLCRLARALLFHGCFISALPDPVKSDVKRSRDRDDHSQSGTCTRNGKPGPARGGASHGDNRSRLVHRQPGAGR